MWSDLTASELDHVNAFKRDRLYRPGEPLYHQGDPCEGIFCIRDGLVGERRVDPDGNSTLLRLNHAGTTLGYRELLTRNDHRNSAEILQDSHVCFLSRSIVSELLARNPKLGERFLRRCVQDAEETEDNYVLAMNKGVRSRLLHTLLVLHERHGSFDELLGHKLEIPIARNDLASLVGTGPETISRAIRRLQEDQLVRFNGRMAYFPDLDAVYKEIMESDGPASG